MYPRGIFIIAALGLWIGITGLAAAQEDTGSEATPEIIAPTFPATSLPDPTVELPATATPTAALFLTPTQIVTVPPTTLPPSETLPPETTLETASTPLPENTETPFPDLLTPTASVMPPDALPSPEITAAPEETITTPDAAASFAPTQTEVAPTETPASTPTLTPTLDIPMMRAQGAAYYQSRQPDHAGITINILNGSRSLLNRAVTDAAGTYIVAVPAQEFFWLVAEAPLHRRFEIGVWPGEPLPEIKLPGGDLDADGCIGVLDVALLTAAFNTFDSPATDINGNGLTDAADLAILAGNFGLGCDQPPADLTPTATPDPESTPVDVTVTEIPVDTISATPLPPENTPEAGA